MNKNNITEELKKYKEMNVFDEGQLYEIKLGLQEGLDVSWYAKEEFNKWEMMQIKIGLKKGLDVSIYAKTEFDDWQMFYIREGLEENLDINFYTDSKFSCKQMSDIRDSLKKGFNPKDLIGKVEFKLLPLFADLNTLGLNINDYLNKDEKSLKTIITRISNKKAKEIFNSKGFDLNDFSKDYITVVKESILDKVDITPYISKEFDSNQLNQIKEGLKNNLNVTLYAYKEFSVEQMNVIKIALEEGLFERSDYFNTKIINGKIKYIPKDF